MLPENVRALKDSEAVAREACRLITTAAHEAIRERGVFRLVLAGGKTPRRAYELLAETAQDWGAWEIFWSDERCLPADHPERNSRMAQEAWLNRVAIPASQIHPIPVELGAAKAAVAYAETIRDKQPFDLVILGMGEDGHTASLFPGSNDGTPPVLVVNSVKNPPAERVTLNTRELRKCRHQLVIITGVRKANALAGWRRGVNLPIAHAVKNNAYVLIDDVLRTAVGNVVDGMDASS